MPGRGEQGSIASRRSAGSAAGRYRDVDGYGLTVSDVYGLSVIQSQRGDGRVERHRVPLFHQIGYIDRAQASCQIVTNAGLIFCSGQPVIELAGYGIVPHSRVVEDAVIDIRQSGRCLSRCTCQAFAICEAARRYIT